jgi:cold shock CspA family protein
VTPVSHGVVTGFDPREGLGTIELADGRTVGFHATQLASGTRHVEVGARVTATLVAWHAGCVEATRIGLDGPREAPAC